jgi:hypothetical protein
MNHSCTRRAWGILAVGVLLWVSACDSPMGPNDPELTGIQTIGSAFSFVQANGHMSGEIPYVFTNRTGAPVYLLNCNGAFGIRLERFKSGGWTTTWSPVIPHCLSAPIVIEPGASFESTISVVAGILGSSVYPRFEEADPSGTHRIVWTAALSSFQNVTPFGEPIGLEYRLSNSFQLGLR